MPVSRDFQQRKGAKIPKIVTYHTAVKTMFMHISGTLFAGEKRRLATVKFRLENGRETEGKKMGRKRHKRERKTGGRERAKAGSRKGAKEAIKNRRKQPRENSRRQFFERTAPSKETERRAKTEQSRRKEKREIKKRNKTGNKPRQTPLFRDGQRMSKIGAGETEKAKSTKLSTILYNEFCNTLD